MTYILWLRGKPFVYRAVRNGKTVRKVYISTYRKWRQNHPDRGREEFTTKKQLTAQQIDILDAIDKTPYSSQQPGKTYFIRAENGLIKIGISKNTKARINSMRTGSPEKLTLIPTPKCADSEYDLHKRFAHLRVSGEWFNPDDELNNYIESISR